MSPAELITAARAEAEACGRKPKPRRKVPFAPVWPCGYVGWPHEEFHLAAAVRADRERVAREAFRAAVRIAVENQDQDKTDWPPGEDAVVARLAKDEA